MLARAAHAGTVLMATHHHAADVAMTPAQSAALRRATPARRPVAELSPWLSKDFGGPPPGGQTYTPEQASDLRAALAAERMAAALAEYARCMRLAAKFPESRRGFQADGRAALHMHGDLLAMLEARP